MIVGLVTLLITACSFVLGGYTLMTLWGWFIVPLGVPAIGFWWGLGLQTTAWMFAPHKRVKLNDDNYETIAKKWRPAAKVTTLLIVYGAALGFGALWHYLMP